MFTHPAGLSLFVALQLPYQFAHLAAVMFGQGRLRSEFWGRHLWARGYFVCSSGNVTDEVIAQYIKLQGAEPQDDDHFRVSED